MNILSSFKKLSQLEELTELRSLYLDGLLKAQEQFLELFIHSDEAEYFLIESKGAQVGYFITHQSTTLIEYFVKDEFLAFSHTLLIQIVQRHSLERALIKSFDHMFLACAMDLQTKVHSRGILVRDFIERQLPSIPSIQYTQRSATEADLTRIQAVDQPVFTHPERLLHAIRANCIRLFEREDSLIGFGLIRPIIAGRPDVDIGIAVDTPFRNKGYAVYMLRDLIHHCLENQLNPVSGCALENVPSIRMGLRVGFLSRYRLLELEFPVPLTVRSR